MDYLLKAAFLLLMLTRVRSQGYSSWTTSCKTNGPVAEGEKAVITCYFTVNPRDVQSHIYVQFYKTDSTSHENNEVVLDCPSTRPCYTTEGYWFDGQVGKVMSLFIERIRKKQAGTYICEDVLTPERNRNGCWLNVTDAATSHQTAPSSTATAQTLQGGLVEDGYSAEDEFSWPTMMIVALVTSFLFAIVFGIVIICIRRRERAAVTKRRKEQTTLRKNSKKFVAERKELIPGSIIGNVRAKFGECESEITSTKQPKQKGAAENQYQRDNNVDAKNINDKHMENTVKYVQIPWRNNDFGGIGAATQPVVVVLMPEQPKASCSTEVGVSDCYLSEFGIEAKEQCPSCVQVSIEGDIDMTTFSDSDVERQPLSSTLRRPVAEPATGFASASGDDIEETNRDEKNVADTSASQHDPFWQRSWKRFWSFVGYNTLQRGTAGTEKKTTKTNLY